MTSRKHNGDPFGLCIFTQVPEAGRSKRGLSPPLTAEEGAALHLAFIDDTLRATRELAGVHRTLYVFGDQPHAQLAELAARENMPVAMLNNADLGERMVVALRKELQEGRRAAAVIGTDAPTLPTTLVAEAFERLDGGCENVIGPCSGGSYYLLGVSHIVRTELFRGIGWGWGGRQVMADTLARIAMLATPSALLPFWYRVDEAEDLSFLRAHLALLAREQDDPAPATRTVLAQVGRSA
jgi:rSAM/selenodomain-associated transferase 1